MNNSLIDINNYILLNKIENSSFNELFTVKDKITGEILAAKISLNSYDESDPLNRFISPDISITIANECIKYFKMSADNGVVEGMSAYGDILAEKSFLPFNLREAAYYYKMAADNGSDSEIMFYVKFLLSGQLGVVNKLEIAKYYKMAADKGNL